MVMTRSTKPRLSGPGVVLALGIAVMAWVATPAFSCPPKPEKCAKAQDTAQKHDAYIVVGGDGDAKAEQQNTYQQYLFTREGEGVPGYVLVGSHDGDDDDDELEARIERLEEQLERLSEHLEQILETRGEKAHRAPRAPKAPRAPAPPAHPSPPAPPSPPAFVEVPSLNLFDNGPTVSKAYHLPENELKALTALMSRDDVPVLIRPGDEEITVQGSPDVQARFDIFVSMLDPGEETVEEYKLSDGKLELLTELMALSDVPVLIEKRPDSIAVHGNRLVQSAFRSFVNLIDPKGIHNDRTSSTYWSTGVGRAEARAGARAESRAKERAERKAERKERRKQREKKRKITKSRKHTSSYSHSDAQEALAQGLAQEKLDQALAAAKGQHAKALEAALGALKSSPEVHELVDKATKMAIEAKLAGSNAQREAIEHYVQSIMKQSEPFLAQAEAMREQARRLEEQADKLQDLAEELESKAEDLRSDADEAPEEKRSDFFRQADEFSKEHLALVEKALAIGEQAADVDSLADQFERRADFFHDAAQAVQDAMEQVEQSRADASDTE